MQIKNSSEIQESNFINKIFASTNYSNTANETENSSIATQEDEQGVTLDISAESYLMQLQEQLENAEKQKDAYADLGKILEIARRISRGDHVPGTDEKKLMEFSSEMYMAAKTMAIISKNKHPKDYDSMFEDEDESEEESGASVQMDSEGASSGTDAVESASDIVEGGTVSAEGGQA